MSETHLHCPTRRVYNTNHSHYGYGANVLIAMYICLCNAITDRQIAQAAADGARTPEDLAQELGVGLGCGRCTSCAKTILVEAIAKISAAGADALPHSSRRPALA